MGKRLPAIPTHKNEIVGKRPPTKVPSIVGKRLPTISTHKDEIVGKKKKKSMPTILPTIKGVNGDIVGKKLKGWIEFPKSGEKRYAKRRYWIPKRGKWVKSKAKRVEEIPPLTDEQYLAYKARQEAAKEARREKDS